MTQTVKHRNEHGRLLSVETRAALGAGMEPAGTVHVERLNGADAAIGSMPSPAKHTPSPNAMPAFDALVGLQCFDHNFHRPHRALRLLGGGEVHRYHKHSPAMALGLTDHLWSFQQLLISRVPITPE